MTGYEFRQISKKEAKGGIFTTYFFDLFFPEMYYLYLTLFLSETKKIKVGINFAKDGQVVIPSHKLNTKTADDLMFSLMEICKDEKLTLFLRCTGEKFPDFDIYYNHGEYGFSTFTHSADQDDIKAVEDFIEATSKSMYEGTLPVLPTRYLAFKANNLLDKVPANLKYACLEYLEEIDKYWELDEMKRIIAIQKKNCESAGYCKEYTKDFLKSLKPEIEALKVEDKQ